MLKVTPRLNEVLKEKGYKSQLAFCNEHGEKYGFNQRAVNAFDRSVQIKHTTLFAIAKALGVTVEELFTVEEEQVKDIPDKA